MCVCKRDEASRKEGAKVESSEGGENVTYQKSEGVGFSYTPSRHMVIERKAPRGEYERGLKRVEGPKVNVVE